MRLLAIIGKLFRILLYGLVVVLGLSLAIVLIFGLKLYCIQTGSMEPQYPVGMMIVVEPVAFEDLREDDVVTFVQGDNTIVTHRAIKINRKTQTLVTKGDNNNVMDASEVHYKNVIGRVKFGIAGVGYAVFVLNTRLGRWIVILTAVALAGIALIRRMYFRSKDDDKDDEEPPRESQQASDAATDENQSGIDERSGGLSAERRKLK